MNKTLAVLAIIGAVVLAQRQRDFSERDGPDDGFHGGFHHRGRGRHHPHHGPPPPPFLRNVTMEARREYFLILRNMTLTIAQQKKEIEEWAQKNDVAEQVAEFNANMTRLKEEVRRNVTQLVNELPQALQRINEIADNEEQTPIELFQALRNLTMENPPLYHLAKFANDIFMRPPRRPRGGPRGREGRRGSPFGPDERFGRPDFDGSNLQVIGPEGMKEGRNRRFRRFRE